MKKLNFACGNDLRKGWDNCDIQKHKDIIYCDANKFPFPFKDNSYDYILLKQCFFLFEHPRRVLDEFKRILKDKGVIDITINHYSNKGSYTDLDTKRFFNEQTFIQYVKDNCRVNKINQFKIVKMDIKPTRVGRMFPRFIREKLCSFINGLVALICIKLQVRK